jgi:hypothetical protein
MAAIRTRLTAISAVVAGSGVGMKEGRQNPAHIGLDDGTTAQPEKVASNFLVPNSLSMVQLS